MSRTGTASGSLLKGVYSVSATSAVPSIQYGMGSQSASGMASMRLHRLWVLAHGDGGSDRHLAAGGDDVVGVEAAVGANGELTGGSGAAHAAHRLPQEMGGAPRGVCSALAPSCHQHISGACGDGEQRVITPLAGVVVALGAFLGQAAGLADGGARSMVSDHRPAQPQRPRLGLSAPGPPGPIAARGPT